MSRSKSPPWPLPRSTALSASCCRRSSRAVLALLPPAVPDVLRQALRWAASRKLGLTIAVALLALLGMLAVASTKLNPQTALFGASLHPSQVMEVERALLLWNEPFTTDDQHTRIFVNASRRREVLVRLTLAGLPHAYVPTTADVLGEQPNAFASSAFMDDRRRAGIQGDLVASLRRINGIADATVVIAPASDDPLAGVDATSPASASVQLLVQPGVSLAPEQIGGIKRFVAASYPGLASDDPLAGVDATSPASASVQLLVQPGVSLAPEQIGGIKRFVAASYPGLAPERVVVVDAGGTEGGGSNAVAPAARSQTALQTSIQTALDAVFGAGNTVVRVSMRTTGEERSSTRTLVTPHGLLEAERGSENGTEGGKRFEKLHTQSRYAYDTVVETRSTHADALARLSIAVLVDSQKISLGQSQQVADVVRAAAGADLRSDQVVVAALPFRAPRAAPLSGGPRPLRALAAAGAAIATLLACWSALAARRGKRPTPEDRAASALQESLRHEMPQTAAYVLGGLPQSVRDRVLRAYDPQQREQILGWMNAKRPNV